jgi:hypothetical protein
MADRFVAPWVTDALAYAKTACPHILDEIQRLLEGRCNSIETWFAVDRSQYNHDPVFRSAARLADNVIESWRMMRVVAVPSVPTAGAKQPALAAPPAEIPKAALTPDESALPPPPRKPRDRDAAYRGRLTSFKAEYGRYPNQSEDETWCKENSLLPARDHARALRKKHLPKEAQKGGRPKNLASKT